jgi:predicted DNA-binding transcriptional regulator YafY
MTYVSSKSQNVHRVHPYTLLMHRDALYLIAYSEKYAEIRTFGVDKMVEARLTKETFDYPADYSPETTLRQSFGIFQGDAEAGINVVADFPEQLYNYVALREWSPIQQCSPLENGRFTMSVRVNNLFEIAHWIMGIGGDARVIEPKELQDLIQGEARKTLELYR